MNFNFWMNILTLLNWEMIAIIRHALPVLQNWDNIFFSFHLAPDL